MEVGTTLKFPATTQEVQAALAKIGIDGKQYTEVFFTSFDSDDVLGLYDYLYEYAGIDELNELAHTLLGVRVRRAGKVRSRSCLRKAHGKRERPYQSGPEP